MAFAGPQIKIPGLKAGADLSAASNQFKLVKISASGTVVLCSAVTDKPCGVLQNRPQNGEAAEVVALGITKILAASADLAAGAMVGTSTAGTAAAYVFGTDTTKYLVGEILAFDNADNDGALVTASVNCINPPRGA